MTLRKLMIITVAALTITATTAKTTPLYSPPSFCRIPGFVNHKVQQTERRIQKKTKLHSSSSPSESESTSASTSSQIPAHGISINDEMMDRARTETFETKLLEETILTTSNENRYSRKIAKIETVSMQNADGYDEPHRYILPIDHDNNNKNNKRFVMVDVPPYSKTLADSIDSFVGRGGQLVGILITSKDAIHHTMETSGKFHYVDNDKKISRRQRLDLKRWKEEFKNVEVISYRLDTPRDCATLVDQRLDGYGPWALDDEEGFKFVETGRPLTISEWDETTKDLVLNQGQDPPDDDDQKQEEEEEEYTPEMIRKNERNKSIIALYTPGRTWGSITFVFPNIRVCCSGYAVPVENDGLRPSRSRFMSNLSQEQHQEEEDRAFDAVERIGPTLDYRGYITTNQAGMKRQIDSCRHLFRVYGDRFSYVLPSNGDILDLSDFVSTNSQGEDEALMEERTEMVMDLLDQYEKIGTVYEQLGITSS